MSVPVLLFASEGKVGVYGYTFMDFGTEYALRTRTVEVAPAGVGGACLFAGTYLLLSFNVPFQIRVTPILDGIEYWDQAVDIAVTAAPEDGYPQTHLFEIAWSFPRNRDGVQVGRYALMGRWFQIEIAMPCPVADEGIIDIEECEHEFEIISSEGGGPQ